MLTSKPCNKPPIVASVATRYTLVSLGAILKFPEALMGSKRAKRSSLRRGSRQANEGLVVQMSRTLFEAEAPESRLGGNADDHRARICICPRQARKRKMPIHQKGASDLCRPRCYQATCPRGSPGALISPESGEMAFVVGAINSKSVWLGTSTIRAHRLR